MCYAVNSNKKIQHIQVIVFSLFQPFAKRQAFHDQLFVFFSGLKHFEALLLSAVHCRSGRVLIDQKWVLMQGHIQNNREVQHRETKQHYSEKDAAPFLIFQHTSAV